nr:YjbH domain-containing protein [Salinisphaera sp.]
WRVAGWVSVVVLVIPAVPVTAIAKDYTGTLPVFQSDYGGTGLLETPTARMAPVGNFAFTYSHVNPYSNFAFSLQPFKWMQAGFRYTSIAGRAYNSNTPNRNYLDKGVDVKFSLVDERRFIPAVALGFRDFGGTGLFGSEYLVANKRWYNLDFSVGLAWGYLGSRGDISNPLSVFGQRFNTRQGGSVGTGKFNITNLFTGRPSVFGGVQYQTPFKPLTIQVEYDGNNYKNEPLGLRINQKSPINFGARFRVNDNLTLSAAYERGNTTMLGGTLSLGLAHLHQPKSDPPPVSPGHAPAKTTTEWNGAVSKLASNAGIQVTAIKRDGDSLIIEGSQDTYRAYPTGELRANRILNSVAGSDIKQFKYRYTTRGMAMREDALPRKPLPRNAFIIAPENVFAKDDYRRDVTVYAQPDQDADSQGKNEKTLYKAPFDRFSWNIRPALNQNYGGPDGYLYQILAEASAEFRTDSHGWISSTLGYSVFDNFNNFKYISYSKLPRVRTYLNEYAKNTNLGVYNLQYTRTARLSKNWFGMGYAGLLERMFGGVGGEVMYRPFNSPVAFGLDANYVRQRGFDTRFDFRNYHTVEGHATMYIDTGVKNILARVSVGRYLAKDFGATIDLSRRFASGVRLGAYATYTSASVNNTYGEGSFNKGIYLSIPLDAFFTKSTPNQLGFNWSPLTRDGGAFLHRRYTLYGLTSDRNLGTYWHDYSKGVR